MAVRMFAAASSVCAASPALAQWHTSVGGNSQRNGLIDIDGPTRVRELWNQTLDTQFTSYVSCPIIAEGKLFVARNFDLSDVDNGSAILAYNVRTGQELWRISIPPEAIDAPNPDLRGPNNVIGYHNGTLYATRAGDGSRVSYLYGLDPLTGAIRWKSPERVFTANVRVGSPAFLENGDLILSGRVPLVNDPTGTTGGLLRVDGQTGAVRWRTNNLTFRLYSESAMAVAIHGNRGYCWDRVEGSSDRYWFSSFDLDTGQRVHSASVPGQAFPRYNLAQQASLMVSSDGIIYVNRLGVALTAFRETETGFQQLWQRPMGGAAFQTNAIGPDGSVYISLTEPLDPALRPAPHFIARINPHNGAEFSRRGPLPFEDASMRFAVDRNGTVYVTNMGIDYAEGRIYALSPDLRHQYWSISAPGSNMGGIALGDGVVAAACMGPLIRVMGQVCTGDFDQNGSATVQDIFSFLVAWFANDDLADVNDDDDVTVQDVFDFLTSWFTGC